MNGPDTSGAARFAGAIAARQDRAKDTRARILAAALNAFLLDGWEKATIRRISRDAGVTMGALTGHFIDKEDLWRAVFGCPPPTGFYAERGLELLRSIAALPDADIALADPALRDLVIQARTHVHAHEASR